VKTAAFGAFVSLLPGRDGLLHISKVGNGKRVERVEDFLNVGDKVEVQIADIDQRGKIYLDKVRPEGEEAPPAEAGGERPSGRDRGERGDRGPRDRGDRDRGPGRGYDRGPSGDRPAGDRPVSERPDTGSLFSDSGEDGGDGEAGGDDEARRRRRRQR
jgi:polyribonucleotide nucleotidyltransferase